MQISRRALFERFFLRELQRNYLGSVSGFAWVFIVPLMQLGIYAFVFLKIFNARVPPELGVGFVPYLAVAFWPWAAFSDSVQRALTAVVDNAGLIAKVALPTEILVAANVAVVHALTLAGYLVVLLVLEFTTDADFHWLMLPLALVVLAMWFMVAMGLSLAASALQVYLRDLEHLVGSLMMLWFFVTPILYAPQMIPEAYRWALAINPIGYFVDRLRGLLLLGDWMPIWQDGVALLMSALVMWSGYALFRRLSPRFEDFL